MKQMSIFFAVLLCLNMIALISSNRYKEYEAPRIVHSKLNNAEPGSKYRSKNLEVLEEDDNNFSVTKILNWISEVEMLDVKTMNKESLMHNLEGIKSASTKIQSYLRRAGQQIEATINSIDLKVNEINIIDKKISEVKPAYKTQLESISKESGSLLHALDKEKTSVTKILEKIKVENDDINKVQQRSSDVERKVELFDMTKNVKEQISKKLVSFVKLDYFQSALKKFLNVVDTELNKNFEAYSKYDHEKIASDLILKNWKTILNEEKELNTEVISESFNNSGNNAPSKRIKGDVMENSLKKEKVVDHISESNLNHPENIENNLTATHSDKATNDHIELQKGDKNEMKNQSLESPNTPVTMPQIEVPKDNHDNQQTNNLVNSTDRPESNKNEVSEKNEELNEKKQDESIELKRKNDNKTTVTTPVSMSLNQVTENKSNTQNMPAEQSEDNHKEVEKNEELDEKNEDESINPSEPMMRINNDQKNDDDDDESENEEEEDEEEVDDVDDIGSDDEMEPAEEKLKDSKVEDNDTNFIQKSSKKKNRNNKRKQSSKHKKTLDEDSDNED